MSNLLKAKRLIWGLIFLLVTAVACLSYFAGTRYLAAVRGVDETLEVQSAIEGTLSLYKDAETGMRGFLLTGDPQFLEPYEDARAGIPQYLADLKRATASDVVQVHHFRDLVRLATDKSRFIDDTIRLRREGDLSTAMILVRTGRGKQLMDAMRAVCKDMRAHEEVLLEQRRHAAESSQQLAEWGVGLGALFTVSLTLLSLLTVHRDVETLRQTAEELAASEEHFRLLTEHSSDLVRLLDLNGKATYVSPSVERLLGFTVEEFMALPGRSLMHPDDLMTAGAILADVKSGKLTGGVSTYRLRHKSGEYRYFEVRWSVNKDTPGIVASLHTAGRDVTERQLAEEQLAAQAEQLRSLSLRDDLTKLYNRRGFLEVAGQAQVQAARDERASALIFVDLNGMKRINDDLGHDVGDSALIDAANVLTAALGESAVIARLGGDEFAAFALDFGKQSLEPMRSRLRWLADAETTRLARRYRISMSVGAAFADPCAREALSDLLERADAAMYEQKRARHAAGGVSIMPPPSETDSS